MAENNLALGTTFLGRRTNPAREAHTPYVRTCPGLLAPRPNEDHVVLRMACRPCGPALNNRAESPSYFEVFVLARTLFLRYQDSPEIRDAWEGAAFILLPFLVRSSILLQAHLVV